MGFHTTHNNYYYRIDHLYCDPFSDFYCSLFFRPKLKIQFNHPAEQNTFAPQATFGGYTQRFIRVHVKNTGYRTVHNCHAQLKVLIVQGDNLMRYPSDDLKPLPWGRYPQSAQDLAQTRDIQSRGSQLLHIVFSDSDFATTPVPPDTPIRYACVSTIDRLRLDIRPERIANNLRVEDSFTNGNFDIEVIITSDEGAYKKTKFRIIVNEDFAQLHMRKLSWFKTKSLLR